MTQPSFKFFARAHEVVPSAGAHAVVLSPEHSEANQKIFAALYKRIFGKDPTGEFVQSQYSNQLGPLCFHPLYAQHPWLMPAAIFSMMKSFQMPRQGQAPLYLRYSEDGARKVPVIYPDGQTMKISIPRHLVLSFDYGNKPRPTGWSNSVIELTKEGLYQFAQIPVSAAVSAPVEACALSENRNMAQGLLFSVDQMRLAYHFNADTYGLTPDGKKARKRKKSGPNNCSGFNCAA